MFEMFIRRKKIPLTLKIINTQNIRQKKSVRIFFCKVVHDFLFASFISYKDSISVGDPSSYSCFLHTFRT